MAFDYLKGKTDKDMSNFIPTLYEVSKVFLKDIKEAEVEDGKCPYFEITLEDEFGRTVTDKTYHRPASETKSGKDEVYFSDFMKALTGCFKGDVFDTVMRLKKDKIPFWIMGSNSVQKNKAPKKGQLPYWENVRITEVWTKEPQKETVDKLIEKLSEKYRRDIEGIVGKAEFNSQLSVAVLETDDDDDLPF